MIKRMKDFIHKYKDDILLCIITVTTFLSILLFIGCRLFMVMCDDLVGVVKDKEAEIEKLTIERNIEAAKADSILQTYEDVIPKQQYIDDIEYLESVILELRNQCKQ